MGKSPIVTPGSSVKAGQALAFIEQLGTFSPVEVRVVSEFPFHFLFGCQETVSEFLALD